MQQISVWVLTVNSIVKPCTIFRRVGIQVVLTKIFNVTEREYQMVYWSDQKTIDSIIDCLNGQSDRLSVFVQFVPSSVPTF